ncbi:MAG: tRNA (adenosine(37)-N6)-threonylcarbamoyltransferase complex dimerization subunit type 1 TsaB [Nitrospirae bacterium]|nr:tRNA (adenosine(37)-N6)-threonylcarbamoyltransferase complex dimerization subunit type 1 TsaB [Nitrospirota bacterium]
MKILAIETATVAGSIAILDDNTGLIAEIRVDVKVVHAERLMPSIQWLMNAAGVSINEIDAFAVSIGPGSFTGLRIGLSTAKGFAYATGKPLVPVPTLDAFARTLPFCSYTICPMLDARRNEVYAGLYRWDGGICGKVLPETAISPAELLQQINGPTVFMGEGAKIYKGLILDSVKEFAVFAPASRMSPSASTVAEIAVEKLKEGTTADPVSLAPFYIRKSEAELRWKG